MVVNSITDLIGSTPCVRLSRIDTRGAEIYVKLERFNPLSSAKDRAALYMIEGAERRGEMDRDTVIIEPTSGNTGIALSYIAAAKGYRCIIVMPENMSRERQVMMRVLGSELVLTSAAEGMKGAIAMARKLAQENPRSFMPMQFENSDNALAHYSTTGPEIFRDFGGSLDRFVAGVGSGGTVSGVGRYLKEKGVKTRIMAVEPASSPVLSTGQAGRHSIQGIGAGFVPPVYDPSVVDGIITVTDEEAFEYTRLLARREGILAGISSGAALAGAVKTAEKGEKVLVLLCDTGERYLSQPFWEEDSVAGKV